MVGMASHAGPLRPGNSKVAPADGNVRLHKLGDKPPLRTGTRHSTHRNSIASSKYEPSVHSHTESRHSRAQSRPGTSPFNRTSMFNSQTKDPIQRFIQKYGWHDAELDEQDLEMDRSAVVHVVYRFIIMPVLMCVAFLLKMYYEGLHTLILETLAGYWWLYAIPFQLAFQHPVRFDELYVISYTFDALMFFSKLYPALVLLNRVLDLKAGAGVTQRLHGFGMHQMGGVTAAIADLGQRRSSQTQNHHGSLKNLFGMLHKRAGGVQSVRASVKASIRRSSVKPSLQRQASTTHAKSKDSTRNSGPNRSSGGARKARSRSIAQRRQRRRRLACKQMLRTLTRVVPFLPFDLLFWGTNSEWLIPYLRLTRMLFAPYLVHMFHAAVEASQLMSFTMSRFLRIVVVFAYAAHWLGCFFFFVAERNGATHYIGAPWVIEDSIDGNATVEAATGGRYLRASYWSMMTLTTTGHVDILENGEDGREWEVAVAMLVVVFATLCFTYMNANITSLIMRHTQTLDKYRMRLSQVDGYLKRNHVSKEVRRLVKRHFRLSLDDEQLKDQALLDQMPYSLRRQVLYDIHMRTMRRVPIFFGCEPLLLQHLCNIVKRVVVLPETILCNQGDVMTEMYFLEAGTLSVFHEDEEAEIESEECVDDPLDLVVKPSVDEELMSCDSKRTGSQHGSPAHARFENSNEASVETNVLIETPGTPLAEAAFFFGLRQDVSVEALRPSACLVLHKSDYSAILCDFPEANEMICTNVKQHLKVLDRHATLEAIEKAHSKPSKHLATFADMLFACQQGNLTVLQDTVREGNVSIGDTDYEGRSCLHIAAGAGWVGLVRCLIEANISVNKRDNAGRNALECALLNNHAEVVDLLVAAGAELGWDTAKEGYHLCDAVRLGHIPTLKLLLSCGVSPNAPTFDQRTALHHAAADGNLKAVELLLAHQVQVNPRDRWGGTPLRDAVTGGQVKIAALLKQHGGELLYEEAQAAAQLCEHAKVSNLTGIKMLLDCHADPSVADYDGRTALHLAASTGNMSIAAFLVRRNAGVNVVDTWGGTPLRDAVRGGHREVAYFLRQHGAVLGYSEEQESGELCEMVRKGDTTALEILEHCGANVNSSDYDKRTPLHLAASEGSLPAISLLLEKKANINSLDRWGGTPLFDAVREGHKAVAFELLGRGGELGFDEVKTSGELCELARNGSLDLLKVMLSCGANINAADYDARTCLHLASSVGNISIVQYLVEQSADVNYRDRWNSTPIVDAMRHGHSAVAYLLHEKGGRLGFDEAQASGELCELARNGNFDRLRAMLQCGVDPNAADYDARTCLHLAACEGALNVVAKLIEVRADLNVKDRWGGTPLQDAVRSGHMGVAKLLMEANAQLLMEPAEANARLCTLAKEGRSDPLVHLLTADADANLVDYDGRAPLHLAACEGHKSVVKALIQFRADPELKDRWGHSPKDEAARAGHHWDASIWLG